MESRMGDLCSSHHREQGERIVRQTQRKMAGKPVRRGAATVPTLCALLALQAWTGTALAQAKSPAGTASVGLPRFVSLKPSKVNLRSGPGQEYPTVWIYRREGLPLEVIKEFDAWRQVRDADGASGWVLQSFLSGRRTALVDPWDVKPGTPPPQIELYADNSERATLIAKVEAGVIANVLTCDGAWCRVTIDNYKGFLQQKKLWGVYEAEVIR